MSLLHKLYLKVLFLHFSPLSFCFPYLPPNCCMCLRSFVQFCTVFTVRRCMAAEKNVNIFDNCCHSAYGNACFQNWLSSRDQLPDVHKPTYLLGNLPPSLQFIFFCNVSLQALSRPSSHLHFLVCELRSSLLIERAN